MRNFILSVAFTFAFVVSAFAAGPNVTMVDVSATQTATTTTIPNAKRVVIVNDGANEIFFTFRGTATTSDARLEPNESWEENSGVITSVSIICSAGETASVRLYHSGTANP